MKDAILSNVNTEGSIDSQGLTTCEGFGQVMNPALISFHPRNMWEIFENQPELKEKFKTQLEVLKDFDNQYLSEKKKCNESKCNNNGACGVPKQLWNQFNFQGFKFEEDSCRCQANLDGGFLADPKDNCKKCAEYSIIEKEECKCPRFYRLNDKF